MKMNLILIFCFLPFALSSPLNQSSCGKRSGEFLRTKIVGGRNVSEGEFPWTVSIGTKLYYPNGTVEIVEYCGGAILSERTVMTAAHCFYDR